MSENKKTALFKFKSWSPDVQREEIWLRRRKNHFLRLAAERRSLSLPIADDRRSLSLPVADDRRSLILNGAADEHRSLTLNADERLSLSLTANERHSLCLTADERRSLSLNGAADERRSFSLTADELRSLSLNAADDRRRSLSGITDDDLDELRACFELGFGFDSNSDLDPKLTKAFPALELYQAVHKLSRSSSSISTVTSDCETPSSVETSVSIVEPGKKQ